MFTISCSNKHWLNIEERFLESTIGKLFVFCMCWLATNTPPLYNNHSHIIIIITIIYSRLKKKSHVYKPETLVSCTKSATYTNTRTIWCSMESFALLIVALTKSINKGMEKHIIETQYSTHLKILLRLTIDVENQSLIFLNVSK